MSPGSASPPSALALLASVVGAFAGWVVGCVGHYLGLLCRTAGDWPAADEYFAAAARTHERIDAPIWLARTRLEWARTLLSADRPAPAERAGDLLGRALATARELGLVNLERQAGEVLALG